MKHIFLGILAGMSLYVQAQEKNTLLEKTFWEGRPGVSAVRAEMGRGNDPAQLNRMAFDPVVLAINNGAPDETILFLLEQEGNTIDKLTHDGRTYVFWAAARGNVAILKYLVAKGADVNKKDSHGLTPLAFAANAGQGNTQVYELLIAGGADLRERNHDGASLLLLAVSADSTLKLAEYFVSKGLSLEDTDKNGNTAFNYAAKGGNIGVMKELLKKGISFNDNAMLLAAQGTRRSSNGLDVFRYLEGLNIKPLATDRNGNNALHYIARKKEQQAVIRYFLEKGVDANQANTEGITPFMNAAGSADTGTVSLLLPYVKDMNRADKSGATALTFAVKGNNADVVGLLINKGCDVNVKDAEGNNLVYYLFESYKRQKRDFAPKLSLLQNKGLDFSLPQQNGNTVYHLAVATNDLSLVEQMSTFGADINARNKEGITALHKAAMVSRDDSILKYLISKGAEKSLETSFNETALDLAKENEFLSQNKVSVDFLK